MENNNIQERNINGIMIFGSVRRPESGMPSGRGRQIRLRRPKRRPRLRMGCRRLHPNRLIRRRCRIRLQSCTECWPMSQSRWTNWPFRRDCRRVKRWQPLRNWRWWGCFLQCPANNMDWNRQPDRAIRSQKGWMNKDGRFGYCGVSGKSQNH